MATPFDWKSLIPIGVGAGLGMLGNKMANAPTKEQNAYSRQQYEQQLARRNAMQGLAMPSMLRAMGNSNPQRAMGQAGLGQGQSPGMASGGNTVPTASIPQTPQSRGSKILGAAGMGLGAAGMLGMGSAFGPIGLAAGAAALGVNQIGKGRRTANTFVDAVENPFGEQLAKFSAGQGSPEEFQQAYQNYKNQTQGWIAQGGNQGKVAQQSLQNQGLQSTIQRLAQQYQVPLGA